MIGQVMGLEKGEKELYELEWACAEARRPKTNPPACKIMENIIALRDPRSFKV